MGEQAGHEFRGNQWTGEGGRNELHAEIRYSDRFPVSVTAQFKVSGAVQALPPGVNEIFKELGGAPRIQVMGQPAPGTMVGKNIAGGDRKNSTGFYRSEDNLIKVFERSASGNKNSNPGGTVVHEIGHAIHDRVGTPAGFSAQWLSDYKSLGEADQHGMRYFSTNIKEMFAETFVHAFSEQDRSGYLSTARFSKHFEGSMKLVRDHVTNFNPKNYKNEGEYGGGE